MPDLEQVDVVEVERLGLAAWMKLNGQRLIGRNLQFDGRIIYVFEWSPQFEELAQRWNSKTGRERKLVRFSRIVSFEIRQAVKMRRAAGLSTRITSDQRS